MTAQVSVWVDKFVKAWSGLDDTPVVYPTMSVVEALSAQYNSDAHFVPYVFASESGKPYADCPRLRNETLAHLSERELKVIFQLAVADIDHADTHAGKCAEPPQEWRDQVWEVALAACPGALVYETRGGMRVVVALPHVMEVAEYVDWGKRFRIYLRSWMVDARVDEIVSPLQCYRCAFVVREGVREQRRALIREPAVLELPSVLEVDEKGAILPERKPFKLPRRIEEGTRHQTLVRYAAQLRWSGMDTTEIATQLADVNQNRCRPAYPEDALVQIARWAGQQATRPDLAPPLAAPRGDDGGGGAGGGGAGQPAAAGGGGEEEPDDEPFQLGDHTEIAERAAVRLRGSSSQPLVSDRGEFRRFEDSIGIWQVLPQHVVEYQIHQYSGHDVRVIQPNGRAVLRPLKINDQTVVGVVKSMHRLLARPGFFDAAPAGMTFADCWVSVSANGITKHAHSADQRSCVAYPFPWTDAKPVKFMQLLNDYWGTQENSDEFASLYLEFVGASLCGVATRYQLCIVFLGEGSNGKSTLVNITVALFPADVVSNVSPQDFGKDSARAMLASSLLNVVGELPERKIDQVSIAALKAMVSGDRLTARWLYKNPFTFSPKAGHLMTANRLPEVEDDSDGTFRRIAVLPFTRKFDAPSAGDRKLHEVVIEEEQAQIVCLALSSVPALMTRGHFVQPKASVDEVTAWRNGQDEISLFLHDRTTPCEAVRGQGTDADSLYTAYYAWAPVNGYKVRNKNNFLAAVDKRRRKFYDNGLQRRMYPVTLLSAG